MPVGTSGASRRAIASWCVYDWANSSFPAIITTFVFAPYFVIGVAESEVAGQSQIAWAVAASALIVAVLSPGLGAIADTAGRRKPWLLALTALCAAGSYLLWYVTPTPAGAAPDPGKIVLALALFVFANAAFEFATVFYNAMLPDVAPRSHIGRVSGWGWGLGYVGGMVCLLLILFGFAQAEAPLFGIRTEEAENFRVAGPIAGLWYAVFAVPLFLFTPDRRSAGIGAARAVAEGLATLVESFREIRKYRNVVRYLIARMIYTDGLVTLFAVGAIYAAGTFGMDLPEVIKLGIAMNLTAAIGAGAFAWVDDWIGPKRTVLIALVAITLISAALLLVTSTAWFWALALLFGAFFGPAQAASRSLMVRLAPPEMMTEMFGLYAFSGKSTAFLGPLLLGWVTFLFDSQRAGMATVLVFFIVGGALLTRVEEPRK